MKHEKTLFIPEYCPAECPGHTKDSWEAASELRAEEMGFTRIVYQKRVKKPDAINTFKNLWMNKVDKKLASD